MRSGAAGCRIGWRRSPARLEGKREAARVPRGGPGRGGAAGALGGSVGGWEEHYDPEKNPRLDPGRVHVVEEDGDIRAMVAVLPLEVFVDGRPVSMGGIADVATHAVYRRRGYAGELMRAALGCMREDDVHLSMLHPFAHAYYRRFGYELATEAISYDLKPTDLPTSPEQARVRAYRDEDFERVRSLFEGEASRHALSARRSEGRWRQILEEQEATVYEADEGVQGYLLYELAEGGETDCVLTLSEVVAATPEAREALVSFAATFDPRMSGVKYHAPRGEPLHPFLPSSYVRARVSPEFMLRLVDVEGALNHLRDREPEAPLVLEVSDDVLPENTGEYTLSNSGAVRGAEVGDRVALDVRQLARLYAGYLSAGQLHRWGLVRPDSPRALEVLETHFPPGDPFVYPLDHF